jgi:hypothetical protein
MVYRFMRKHRNEYAIRKTAEIFEGGGGAYYRRAKHGVSRIQERHHYRYGSPWVREDLRRE